MKVELIATRGSEYPIVTVDGHAQRHLKSSSIVCLTFDHSIKVSKLPIGLEKFGGKCEDRFANQNGVLQCCVKFITFLPTWCTCC
jgi:hypothetical protein